MGIFWILTMLGAVIGAVDFINVHINAQSAPQQAAGAAMALCWVVIPYCFARAVSEIGKK